MVVPFVCGRLFVGGDRVRRTWEIVWTWRWWAWTFVVAVVFGWLGVRWYVINNARAVAEVSLFNDWRIRVNQAMLDTTAAATLVKSATNPNDAKLQEQVQTLLYKAQAEVDYVWSSAAGVGSFHNRMNNFLGTVSQYGDVEDESFQIFTTPYSVKELNFLTSQVKEMATFLGPKGTSLGEILGNRGNAIPPFQLTNRLFQFAQSDSTASGSAGQTGSAPPGSTSGGTGGTSS